MSTPSSVRVGCVDRTAWIQVEGRGSFQNSSGLKEFVKQMIQRGFRDFVVDLQACEQMDSTFMGTLAGVALRLRELGQGALKAINVNERNADLLSNLGLDQLFTVQLAADGIVEPAPEDVRLKEAAKGPAGTEEVFAAHETLAELSPANAVKFKDVLEFLHNELNARTSSEE